jgi:radical SAM protein with 4Fe4S-binding SPASM domain
MDQINLAKTPNGKINKLFKIMLWLNSGCNAKCITCDIWREKPGKQLSYNQIKKLAPQWKELGVNTIVICGEPLINPNLWPIVDIINKQDINIEMLTNGINLSYHAEKIVNNCKVLRVSLDGPKDIHNLTRGKTYAYERLKQGMDKIRYYSPDYNVSAHCTIHLMNFEYISNTINTAKELQLSGIAFSATDTYNQEAFKRADRIDEKYVESLTLSSSKIDDMEIQLNNLIEMHKEDFESGFIAHSPEKLKYLLIDYYREIEGGACRKLKCNSPWTSVVIEYDGTLRPCFPMSEYANINDFKSMKEALNSTKAQSMRKNLVIEKNDICRRCVNQTVSPS